jgi:hypothetical protein
VGLELEGMGLWTYPAKPPVEPCAYILDDEGIICNPNSLWPFWTPKSRYNGHYSNPAVIRIAPDTQYQAWGQEYILLGDRAMQRKAGVSFHISIEPKGMCYLVAHCHAEIDQQTWEISDLICHPSVEQAARAKLEKVIEFLKRPQQEAHPFGHHEDENVQLRRTF